MIEPRWSNIDELQKGCEPIIFDALALAHYACGIELQAYAINHLAALDLDVWRFWQAARKANRESDANNSRIFHELIFATAQYLWMWIDLKKDRIPNAWHALVEAQQATGFALATLRDPGYVATFYNTLMAAESLLFPHQQFVSPGLVYDYAKCSICGGVHGECDHLTGMIYNGEICEKVPQEFERFDHIAFVASPRDKMCRVTELEDKTSVICTFTKRVLRPADEPEKTGFRATVSILRPTGEGRIAWVDLDTFLPVAESMQENTPTASPALPAIPSPD